MTPLRFAASAFGANRLIGDAGISSALSEIFGIIENFTNKGSNNFAQILYENKKSRRVTAFLLFEELYLYKYTLNTDSLKQLKTILAAVLLAVYYALDTRLNNEL